MNPIVTINERLCTSFKRTFGALEWLTFMSLYVPLIGFNDNKPSLTG